jgi:hypothetical protein
VKDSLAGLDRASSAIGYRVKQGLREGLVPTWEWFRTRFAA